MTEASGGDRVWQKCMEGFFEGPLCPEMNPYLEMPQHVAHLRYDVHRALNFGRRLAAGLKGHLLYSFLGADARQPSFENMVKRIEN